MTVPWWLGIAALSSWSVGIVSAVVVRPRVSVAVMTALVLGGTALCSGRRSVVVPAALLGLAFLLGTARAALAAPTTLAPSLDGQPVVIAGRIDDDPTSRRNGTRLVVAVDRLLLFDRWEQSRLRVVATVFGIRSLHYGDAVLLTGHLSAPPSFEQFDYRAYLSEQGIAAVLDSPRLVRAVHRSGDPLHAALFGIRHALVHAVDRALPEPQAALVLGVVFGYRTALPHTLEQLMIASGLIHIVVISGLKVSLLARIVHQAFGRFLPRAAPFVALMVMVLYALLAGASAAALRAAAMGALVVLAGTLKRDTHVYTSMALTAAVMLGLKPDLARDVSFQLSFAGTLGIAAFTDPIAARLGWIPALLRDPFAATVAAEAATWPLMLADFHQLSLVAPLANALVLPLLPVMIVLGGGGAIAASVWPLAGWSALQLAGVIALWFQRVIEATGAFPLAALVTPYFPARWLAAAALLNAGALAGVRLRRFFWQRKVWALLGGTGLVVLALLLVRPDGRVHVYALDVGTGSAVVIRTENGEQILIDGGPDPDRFAPAIGRALPPTARRLRIWLVTGGRRAQIGAGSAVLTRFQVERLIIADPDPWTPTLRALVEQARRAGIRIESGIEHVEVDGVQLTVASDARTWLVRSGQAVLAVIPPGSDWRGYPKLVPTAIFTGGGPEEWPPVVGQGVAVVQVSAMNRDGLPAHAFLRALQGTGLLRTDRLGTVELVPVGDAFMSPG